MPPVVSPHCARRPPDAIPHEPQPRTQSSRPISPRHPAADRPHDDAAAKNRPLVEDIRLLGRILGDVIREQEGGRLRADRAVRQLSVAYRLKRDASAGRVLDRLLKNLSGDQTVSVIRAFSYFSHLANIAEDRHHVRRREAARARGAPARRARWRVSLRAAAPPPGTAPGRHRRARCSTPTSRRCSPRTPPRCSARASSTPSVRSPSYIGERDALATARERTTTSS
jgi:hypothetical protein